MKKFKITSTKKAIEKQMVKIGDTIWVKAEIVAIDEVGDIKIKTEKDHAWLIDGVDRIRIEIQKPKPINFSEANRVLKRTFENSSDSLIIMTTGYQKETYVFSGYVLEDIEKLKKGSCCDDWYVNDCWIDITDTYKNNTNGN